MNKCWHKMIPLAAALLLAACSNLKPAAPMDYSAFKESDPKSILVLPPLNESPDIKASAGMMTASVRPLAEAGYYVFPAAVVNETFQQNGLVNPAEIHAVQLEKLRQIFGTDAVLYITVKQYGTSYQVIQSDTRVTADARLVDARSGKELWSGSATASTAEQQNQNQGLAGMLLSAIVNQIVASVGDRAFDIAQITGARLLQAGPPRGILPGPRSPQYGQQTAGAIAK